MDDREMDSFVASNLTASTLITKENDVSIKRRGKQLLLIAPRAAGWLVLDGLEAEFWHAMGRGGNWLELQTKQHPLGAKEREALMGRLYRVGLIKWNGRGYYNTDAMWQYGRRYPTFLCLHLTEACNFACKYCMADSVPSNGRMPVPTMELILAKCMRELPPKCLRFDFHGGEPLMAWEQMLHAVRFARELNEKEGLGKELSFIFQTNGSLLTADKVQILKDENIHVGVSMDGPAEVHDANRVFAGSGRDGADRGTHALVVKNYLAAREAGIRVGLLGVVHEPADYLKCFDYFVNELKARSFRLNYSSFIGRSVRMLDFPATRAEAFADYWLQMIDRALAWCREHHEKLDISDVDNQLNNLISKQRPFMCYRSPCGVGNSILGFAIDGGVHACEEMASTGMLRLGSVFDEGFNLKDMVESNPLLLDLQKRTVDSIPRCRRCELRRFCFGGCTSKTLAYYGDYMHESPMCRFYQRVFVGLMWRLYDNPDMLSYLGSRCCKPCC
ncbi:radical SAM protein [bacterium]|nr:radical SAM protein [bacterium]